MRKQKGLGVVGFLIVIGLVIFFAYLAFLLVPPYYESYAVNDAIKELAKDPEITAMSKVKLKDALTRKLQVNNIRNFTTNEVAIEEDAGKSYLVLNYEVRVNVFKNLDAVMRFDNKVMVQ